MSLLATPLLVKKTCRLPPVPWKVFPRWARAPLLQQRTLNQTFPCQKNLQATPSALESFPKVGSGAFAPAANPQPGSTPQPLTSYACWIKNLLQMQTQAQESLCQTNPKLSNKFGTFVPNFLQGPESTRTHQKVGTKSGQVETPDELVILVSCAFCIPLP